MGVIGSALNAGEEPTVSGHVIPPSASEFGTAAPQHSICPAAFQLSTCCMEVQLEERAAHRRAASRDAWRCSGFSARFFWMTCCQFGAWESCQARCISYQPSPVTGRVG